MALSQQKFREIIFQLLFSQEIANPEEDAMTDLMMHQLEVTKKNVKLAQEKLQQLQIKLPEIDQLIRSAAVSYEFDRIQQVTINILRLGVYEMFFDETIPPKVAISEAIRLSRKFSSPESASFVNALLDHLYQKSLGLSPTDKNLADEISKIEENEKLTAQLIQEKNENAPQPNQEINEIED